MNYIIFNPLKNRKPNGSVSNKKEIEFYIKIEKNYYFKDLFLILYDDFENRINTKKLVKMSEEDEYNIYSVSLNPLNTGIYFYYFEIHFRDCIKYIKNDMLNAKLVDNIHELPMWQLSIHNYDLKTPDWFKGSIMYQIFPDRFKKSDKYITNAFKNNVYIHENWYETPHSVLTHEKYSANDFYLGNLLGVQEEKKYFKKLNIESIYFNPISESSENHRYSTANYLKIDPFFGTNEQFINFCNDFKKEGINIILDGVFSHTGSDSIYFNRYNNYDEIGAYNSKDSKYYNWYKFIDYPNIYYSWWGFDNLPTVDKNNEDFFNFITKYDTGVINYWQKLGIKGWRLDVADEFPDSFLENIYSSAKKYDEEALIIGEVWEDASTKMAYNERRKYFQGKQLDSVMNYPWRDAIVNFVKYGNEKQFEFEINNLIDHYPIQNLDCLMNLLSSHDIPRLLTTLAVEDSKNFPMELRANYILNEKTYNYVKELSKFAAFIQFTLPGVPSIYYGDEIGMYGFTDPFNRLGFNWNNIDYDLLDYYTNLSNFRFENKENFKTGFEFLYADNGCICYKRNKILCIINISDKHNIIEKIKDGDYIFGNNLPEFTKYGIVVPKKSYMAIKVK